jgi:hypothetical protein
MFLGEYPESILLGSASYVNSGRSASAILVRFGARLPVLFLTFFAARTISGSGSVSGPGSGFSSGPGFDSRSDTSLLRLAKHSYASVSTPRDSSI